MKGDAPGSFSACLKVRYITKTGRAMEESHGKRMMGDGLRKQSGHTGWLCEALSG